MVEKCIWKTIAEEQSKDLELVTLNSLSLIRNKNTGRVVKIKEIKDNCFICNGYNMKCEYYK